MGFGLQVVELYDGGAGNTDLSGHVLVFFVLVDGFPTSVLPVIDLDGLPTRRWCALIATADGYGPDRPRDRYGV